MSKSILIIGGLSTGINFLVYGLPIGVMTGRKAIRMICGKDGKKFSSVRF